MVLYRYRENQLKKVQERLKVIKMKKVLLLAQQAFTENGETYEAMATDVFANVELIID